MKSIAKWVAIVVGGLVLMLAVAAFIGLQMGEAKKARVVNVSVAALPYVSDAQSVERGKYLFDSRGCAECHGANGAGRDFEKSDSMQLTGANITPAGITASYKPADWDRAIRHGVKPDGRPILVMPSEDYNRLTDADFAAIVAYVRSLAPVQGGGAVVRLPLPARVLYGFGAIPDAAERIDHSKPSAQPVVAAVNAQHGSYVANMCIGCHGEHLSGGKIAGGPPDWPAAANLTPGDGSVMSRYPDSTKFVAMLRSGKRPDGSAIQVMPFGSLSKLSDVDAQALYEFLKTVPAKAAGGH